MPQLRDNKAVARILGPLACLAALTLLCGCQRQGAEAPYDSYLTRLGRTLSVEVPEVVHPVLPRPRRTGQLRLEIPSGSLDTLDFLALSGCAVQVTIGKRNSSLGRMARDSQHLLLDLEYLRLAPQCITRLRDDKRDSLADVLAQAWRDKQRQLPALLFNATLGGDEYRALWLTPRASRDYPAATASQVISSLEAINGLARNWLDGDYQADNLAFELLLSEVAGGDAGALLRALSRQNNWLQTADLVLEQRMARSPLCSSDTRPAAAAILPNVIEQYFIGEIQPRAAQLARRQYELLPPIAALEEQLVSVLPPDYRAWMADRDNHFFTASSAPRRHVENLIAIQQPCPARR